MNITNKLLPTTVVGSYPVVKSLGLHALIDPLFNAVKTAVGDQIDVGIDIISDGQVRGDMITVFTSRIPGIHGQTVFSRVEAPQRSITLQDTKYALTRHPMVKGIITGPSTLAHALKISTPVYRTREELILDLARALVPEARSLEAAGVRILQIDEPIMSTGMADLEIGRKAIEIITSNLAVHTCLHVCGELIDVIDGILEMPVSILDFEFAASQENHHALSGREIGDRLIGYGCVDTQDPSVESVSTILKRIERGIELLGPDTLLIDPDCGMRMLSRDVAFRKLQNMVEAVRRARIEHA
ncbi:MAG: methionine synthase [Methanomicrobiales archaeon]|nr:methionine synthase [Methanomicrobiales archaeon]